MSVLTVVAAARTYDLTTLKTVKTRLKIETGKEDENIQAWISDASDAIATECNRVFGKEDLSEVFHAQHGREDGRHHFHGTFGRNYQQLILARRPIISVAAIDENGTVIDPSLYEVDAAPGLVRLANNRSVASSSDPLYPRGKLTVLYTAGFDLLDSLPRSLERACIRLVAHYRASETRDPFVRSVDVPGVMSTQYQVGGTGDNGALPPEVMDLISRFRDENV